MALYARLFIEEAVGFAREVVHPILPAVRTMLRARGDASSQ